MEPENVCGTTGAAPVRTTPWGEGARDGQRTSLARLSPLPKDTVATLTLLREKKGS